MALKLRTLLCQDDVTTLNQTHIEEDGYDDGGRHDPLKHSCKRTPCNSVCISSVVFVVLGVCVLSSFAAWSYLNATNTKATTTTTTTTEEESESSLLHSHSVNTTLLEADNTTLSTPRDDVGGGLPHTEVESRWLTTRLVDADFGTIGHVRAHKRHRGVETVEAVRSTV